MKLVANILVTCVLLALCVSCRRQNETVVKHSSDVLAVVGDAVITSEDVAFAKVRLVGLSDGLILDRLISEETLAQCALRDGLAEEASVRAAIRGMLASRYLEKHLRDPVVVTDDDVLGRWEDSREEFLIPARAKIAIIRRSFEGDAEKSRVAEEMLRVRAAFGAEATGGRGFGRLAAKHSDHQDTRYQGGECGWVSRGRGHVVLPTEVVEVATSQTRTGLVEDVVEAEGAMWLLLVEELQPRHKRPFGDVKGVIRRELEGLAQMQARQAFLDSATKSIPSEVVKPLPRASANELAESPAEALFEVDVP